MRKFSVPYNNSEPSEYLKILEKYRENIDSIFLGLPSLGNFNNPFDRLKFYEPARKRLLESSERTFRFLEDSRGLYKRLVASNNLVDISIRREDDGIIYFKEKIYPLIEKYEIDGFILTNYTLLKELHKDFPNLSLQSSCNCMLYDLKSMDYWRKAGCTVFNPPRNSSIDIPFLEKMKKEGFIIKILVNENCVHGCPKMMNHNADSFHMSYPISSECLVSGLGDVFKTNLILPEWLSDFDGLVDIYKLKGRSVPLSFLSRVISAYMTSKSPLYLNDFVTGGLINYCNSLGLLIPSSLKPKKILRCLASFCDSCGLCESLAKFLVKSKPSKK